MQVLSQSGKTVEEPHNWREKNVPIFKKGEKEDPSNTTVKLLHDNILEYIIKRSICKHLENHLEKSTWICQGQIMPDQPYLMF